MSRDIQPRPTHHPRRSVRRLLAIGAVALAGAQGAGASPGEPRVLLDTDLAEHEVRVLRLDDRAVSFLDRLDIERRWAIDDLVALVDTSPDETSYFGPRVDADAQGLPVTLDLTDGQRLMALVPTDASDDPETLTVRLAGGYIARIPIDHVARLTVGRGPGRVGPLGQPPSDDVLILANGDRLAGFVEAIGPEVHIDVGGTVRRLDLDRVTRIRLANPPESPRGLMIWLRDGTVISPSAVQPEEGGRVTLSYRPPGAGAERGDTESAGGSAAALRVPIARITALRPARDDVLPLASVETLDYRPVGQRRWTPPSTIPDPGAPGGIASVTLPGPMEVEWALPAEAFRFGATVTLGERPGPWAGCEVVVELRTPGGSRELAREPLTREQPSARVRVDLEQGQLTRALVVRIEPGERGPVQNTVTLVRPVLLLGR